MSRKSTPQVEELLEMLIEECAEVQQIACKCLRHGMESYHPDDKNQIANWVSLLKEIGDARTLMWLIVSNHTPDAIGKDGFSCSTGRHMLHRWERKRKWTHHQTPVTKEEPLRTADKYPEYKGMSAAEASRSAEWLVTRAHQSGNTLGDLGERLLVLREIYNRDK